MKRAIDELNQWLARHNVSQDNVVLKLVMPSEASALAAELALKADAQVGEIAFASLPGASRSAAGRDAVACRPLEGNLEPTHRQVGEHHVRTGKSSGRSLTLIDPE